MNELRRRLDRLEGKVNPPEPHTVMARFLWLKGGQTPEEAFLALPLREEDRRGVIFVEWQDDEEPRTDVVGPL